jgi:abhydrolase domain-containing protein 12
MYLHSTIKVLTKYWGGGLKDGVNRDALAMVDRAMNVAGISPPRILTFGQLMGTAIAIAVSRQLAL